jgi:hypothetical protein
MVPSICSATTWATLSTANLVEHSDNIVLGTVRDVREMCNDEAPVQITIYTIELEETFRGTADNNLVQIPVLGGCFGDDCLFLAGTPRLTVGAKYLLFLSDVGYQVIPFLGGEQGIFRVEEVAGEERVFGYGGNLLTIEGEAVVSGAVSEEIGGEVPLIVNHLGISEVVVDSPRADETAALDEVVELITQLQTRFHLSSSVLEAEFAVEEDSPWSRHGELGTVEADLGELEGDNE